MCLSVHQHKNALTLIKSISGFRGTIGGQPGQNLTPIDVVSLTAAYGTWVIRKYGSGCVVVGRDGRVSGALISQLVCSTLQALGLDVLDLGLSTTPTVEMAVVMEGGVGGIVLTASHNPREWNALKLLNHRGEFINGADGAELLQLVGGVGPTFADVGSLGVYRHDDSFIARHIEAILALPLTDAAQIRSRRYKVVVDAVNSTGAISVPPLLEALGCEVLIINGEINGQFAHNPEPLKEHLEQLSAAVRENRADFGIAVDPDVDRLVFMCEDGNLFGEEYTLVAVADYVLSKLGGGPTVSNLSSSRALRDITLKHGGTYHASAVGEVHVVAKMKATGATIGGEGNGGIIVPDLHYGRDALVGIAYFLSHLSSKPQQISTLRQEYPNYFMVKSKFAPSPDVPLEEIFEILKEKYHGESLDATDGLKIDFEAGWVHLRASNTEPIIRIYAEGDSEHRAEKLVNTLMEDIQMFRQHQQ